MSESKHASHSGAREEIRRGRYNPVTTPCDGLRIPRQGGTSLQPIGHHDVLQVTVPVAFFKLGPRNGTLADLDKDLPQAAATRKALALLMWLNQEFETAGVRVHVFI